MVYLGGRVIELRAHVEMRQESRESQDAALWHPEIEPRRVSDYE